MFGLGKEQGGLARLGLGEQNKLMGLGGESNQQSRLLQGHTMQGGLGDGFSSKDWQDGLRALLPNVNVSFGGGQNHGSSGLGNGGGPGLGGNMSGGLGGLIQSLGPPGGHSHYGLQNSYQNSYSQDRGQQQQQQQQHNSNWGSSINSNGMGGNDWTMLDPAIVTGQLSGPHPDYGQQSAGIRSDSPPNWIRDNLEQLTAEPNSSPYSAHGGQSQLSHAFNGLGLGAGQARRGMAGWGGATTATPPPGFSHHRQPLAQQGYQGFKAAQEGPKIGDFN